MGFSVYFSVTLEKLLSFWQKMYLVFAKFTQTTILFCKFMFSWWKLSAWNQHRFSVNTVRGRHLQLLYRLCLVCVEFRTCPLCDTHHKKWVNLINSPWVYNTYGSFVIQSLSNLGEIFLSDLNFWSILSWGLHMNWNDIFLNVNLCKNYLVTSALTSVFAAHSYISLHFIFCSGEGNVSERDFFFSKQSAL